MKRLRNSILLLIVVCVLIPTLASGEPSDKRQISYSFSNIAHLNYGSADDQIGLLQEPGVPPTGPESFWVDDEGYIYICDTANKKIKIFSADGQLTDQMPVGFKCNDVTADDQGNVFVLDRARRMLHCFSKNRKASLIAIDKSLIAQANILNISDGKLEIITNSQDRYLVDGPEQFCLTAADQKTDDLTVKTLRKPRIRKRQPKAILKRTKDQKAEITFPTNNSSLLKAADSNNLNKTLLPARNVVSSTLIGSDSAGNYYIQIEQMNDSGVGVELCVYVLNKGGKIVCVIDNIPNNYCLYTAKLLQINAQGDIYQMLPTDQGIEINCWKRNK